MMDCPISSTFLGQVCPSFMDLLLLLLFLKNEHSCFQDRQADLVFNSNNPFVVSLGGA